MEEATNILSKKLIKNAKKLGLIQVSEIAFKVSIHSDFTADLSASGDSKIDILSTILKQAAKKRDYYQRQLKSTIQDNVNYYSSNLKSFNELTVRMHNLHLQNKMMSDFLIELNKTKRSPSLEEIASLQESIEK